MAVRRVHVRVTGRVQGVWFRASTRDVARSQHATGWVANRPDGSVEGEVQGSAAAVEAVLAFLERGPELAVVDQVAVQDQPVVDGEVGFEVR